jgi:hypothetical protein
VEHLQTPLSLVCPKCRVGTDNNSQALRCQGRGVVLRRVLQVSLSAPTPRRSMAEATGFADNAGQAMLALSQAPAGFRRADSDCSSRAADEVFTPSDGTITESFDQVWVSPQAGSVAGLPTDHKRDSGRRHLRSRPRPCPAPTATPSAPADTSPTSPTNAARSSTSGCPRPSTSGCRRLSRPPEPANPPRDTRAPPEPTIDPTRMCDPHGPVVDLQGQRWLTRR